jgi:uncharacterized protein (DUF2147 family)
MRLHLMLSCLWAFLFVSVLVPHTAVAQDAGADAALGVWKNGEGTGLIQITKRDNKYYGKIVWLKVPNDAQGQPRKDINNPDEKLRSRYLKGMENMRDFVYAGDNKWEKGHIYDPKNGNDYDCSMTLTGPSTLEVRGFIGISLLGRTDVWTRQVKKG